MTCTAIDNNNNNKNNTMKILHELAISMFRAGMHHLFAVMQAFPNLHIQKAKESHQLLACQMQGLATHS